jgi:undecaprenyl-diphosphatase
MTILQAIIIAVIEGITEFLPISSTAHMKFANPVIGVQNSPFTDMFEVVIQFAAILSVVVIFYKKFFDFKRTTFYLKLIIAVIPALIAGAVLKSYIDSVLENLTVIACVMIGGGILLLFIDRLFTKNNIEEEREISIYQAFAIGCFQCLSILMPGLSRSAATIVGGMQQKLTRKLAAEFSFFLAVPTMFAASVKSFYDVYKEHPDILVSDNMSLLAIGAVVSFIVALIAVKSFIFYLQKHGFRAFGIYRIILGVIILVFIWKGLLPA